MRPSFYTRLALSLGLLLCVAMLTLGWVLIDDAGRRFEAMQLSQARAQATTLAHGSLDALVTGDYELLERWVRSVLPADYYAYAYLDRADGQILIHTDIDQIARYAHPLGALESDSTRSRVYSGRPVKEVVYPARIGSRHLANAHVAYYLDTNVFYQAGVALKIGLLVAGFLMLLLVSALVIVRHQTVPLTHLSNHISMFSHSKPRVPMHRRLLGRNDEVGNLARAFDAMTTRLWLALEELRNEEDRLKSMVEERTEDLVRTNKELEAFSYSVSHDLRAPLRAIDGFSLMLLEDYGHTLDESAMDCLRRVRTASNRMSELIDDLLQLSRVGRQEMHSENIDLTRVANDVAAELIERDPSREVMFDINEGLTAKGDESLVRILMDNLLGNAWKYSSKKTTAHIEFGATNNGGETVFFVGDNGSGFDMRYAERLFDPFSRLHSAEFEGTGVGLATVARIIRRHGGRIWAQAEVGQGATFYFTLGAPEEAFEIDTAA